MLPPCLPPAFPGAQARRACGLWLNSVRNGQRMLCAWAPAEEAHLVAEYARWNAAITSAACAYLRRKDCFWVHCAGLLTPAEIAWLSGCENAPIKVSMILSKLLARWAGG